VPLSPVDETSTLDYVNDIDSMAADDSEKPNPFAILQGLKK
jgi:uncharacterized metal-binding protein YceD (DUF177 family)